MTIEQVENRFAVIEAELADFRTRLALLPGSPDPKSRWWENVKSALPALGSDEQAEYDARAKYFRQTGDWPPSEWNPGDPIPEPEHWK